MANYGELLARVFLACFVVVVPMSLLALAFDWYDKRTVSKILVIIVLSVSVPSFFVIWFSALVVLWRG